MIWGHMFDEFSNMKPIHLVGFGAFGPAVTGLCYDYGWMWSEPELVALHNTYLQYLIDFGYIGLLIFLAMTINIFKILGKTNKVVGKKSIRVFHPAMAAMLYLAVCGLFEVNIYFNQILTFYVFMFINYQVIWQFARRKSQFNTELVVE
jgi:O-antigen ligase